MTRPHKERLAALAAGVTFGAGLAVSGMTLPTKVQGFLDFTGAWDPTLLLVMGGAIAAHLPVYRLVRGRSAPLFGARFQLPTRKDIDLRLVAGAALFGLGWGLGGYCPGPAVTSLVSGSSSALVFVAAMLVTMWATARVEARLGAARQPPPTATKPQLVSADPALES